MARAKWSGADRFHAAAERFVETCLRRDGSLFTPERSIWNPEVAGDRVPAALLDQTFGGDSFDQKLADELDRADDAVRQFVAEVLFVHALPQADLSAGAKLDRIRRVLDRLEEPITIPDDLRDALAYGIASYGAARVHIADQFRFLLRFASTWKRLGGEERDRLLEDGWAFKEWLAALPRPGAGTQFEALLYTMHPDTFEPVVSSSIKGRIKRTFEALGDGHGDQDAALAAIRTRLEPLLGGDFSYYDELPRRLWDSPDGGWPEFVQWAVRLYEDEDFDTAERNYKVEIAEKLAAARHALDDDWLPGLRAAFGSPNNLTSDLEHLPFLEWCEQNREDARELLASLWEGDYKRAMDGALHVLPADVLRGRAARASIASFLLGGRDPTRFPFFRMTVYDQTCALVQRPVVSREATAGELYEDFLALLDELRLRLLTAGTETRDRLDAQSLAWWITTRDPPEGWSDADKQAFLAYRAGVGNGPDRERAWLVRGANNEAVEKRGENMLPTWFAEGFVSIGWPNAKEIDSQADLQQIREHLREANPELSEGAVIRGSGILRRFLDIRPGDWILTPDGDKLYLSRAAGSHYWREGEASSALRLPVRWLNISSPRSRTIVERTAPNLYRSLKTALTVSDLTDHIEAIRALVTDVEEPLVPPASDLLARRLLLPREWLQEVVDLLNDKGQVIFYGPPGTGKTFVAQALGEHVEASGGTSRLVQFHPAYSYEDFFEGYRPEQRDEGGPLAFRLRHGPLREMVDVARDRPDMPHLLVIDEINRGNIAKIFGELYFLLEYRDRSIRLQYSPDADFSMPRNLFFIGTMNTADRSIALVDSALRRRFYFVPFLPREAPIEHLLGAWLRQRGLDDEAALLLDQLNGVLADRPGAGDEFAIGPSYFMIRDGEPDLERVWSHAILPLLEERFYGELDRAEVAAEFGLAAIRARLAGAVVAAEPEPEAAE